MKYPPQPLSGDQVRALIGSTGAGWRGARNAALLATLWRCGLRAFEACGLELEHLEPLEAGAIRVTVARPKGGGQPRTVGLDAQGGDLVRAWLELRGGERGHLFITRSGRALHPSYLRQLLPLLAKRAGMQRRVHPHALRHTFARELYDEGIGIREIQVALGHRSLATTETYLRSIGATRAVEVTASRRW